MHIKFLLEQSLVVNIFLVITEYKPDTGEINENSILTTIPDGSVIYDIEKGIFLRKNKVIKLSDWSRPWLNQAGTISLSLQKKHEKQSSKGIEAGKRDVRILKDEGPEALELRRKEQEFIDLGHDDETASILAKQAIENDPRIRIIT